MVEENPYMPEQAMILGVKRQTHDTKTYTFAFVDEEKQREFTFQPGEFNMITLLGVGEAPFSICSSPSVSDSFEHTIRSVGNVTSALARLKEGDIVGIRGPYGKGWPMEEAEGKDVLIVAGGVGFPPVRPVITYIADHRAEYGSLEVLYGARTPGDCLFTDEYDGWKKTGNTRLLLTVDRVPGGQVWEHNVGVVTALFDQMETSPENVIVLTCGPEIMMRFVVKELIARGFRKDQLYVSLERRMKCGLGKCGHCQIGPVYVCRDGPVFAYADIEHLPDKIV